jgi:hypothetical protein
MLKKAGGGVSVSPAFEFLHSLRRIVMDFLKNFWPMSFKKNDSVSNLVIGVIVYVVVGIIAGLIIGLAGLLTGWIPVVGPVLGIILSAIGTLVEVYTVAGIVIKFLAYFNVLKD